MKTILAALVSIAFVAPAAMACPGHDSAESKTVKKDEKGDAKQADAKPAPKAPTQAPATIKPAPKAPTKAAPKAVVKVSQK